MKGANEMKRKIDINKVYKFIGQATIFIIFNATISTMLIYGLMTATTLR